MSRQSMKGTGLDQLLGQLGEAPAPEPSALFVAKLEADLRAMDQAPEAQASTKHRRTRRARLLVAAAPVAALATAAAAAAVTFLPSKPHPHQVNTADPGVSAPAPPPPTPPSSVPTPTTVVAPPWLPPSAAPSPTPTTTSVVHQQGAAPAPQSGEHPAPTIAAPHEPASTTVPPTATTTTAPAFETPSLHCVGGVSEGTAGVSCTWSASTSSSFHWYRLYREVAGTNRVLVFSSDNRSVTAYADKSVQTGTTYAYRVEFTDAAGNVIGRSAATSVSCC